MSPKMTRARKRALNRRADGTFGAWTGGQTKRQLAKKENTFQGIATHIGKEFKRQHGHVAKAGAVVRTKRKDGGYHQGAYWYIRTPHGWRKSPTETRRPSKSRVKTVLRRSRPGRR